MKLDRDSAIFGMVTATIDGRPLERCIWLDMEKGEAEVLVTDFQGKLMLDERGNPVRQTVVGKIELKPTPGNEDRVTFYLFGWAERGWHDQARKAAAERRQGEQPSQP